jgi:hypothetical protein
MKNVMERYQQKISALLTLASIAGLFGIGRAILVAKDSIVWVALGFMFVIAWIARRMFLRMPIEAEGVFRVANAPAWSDLSPMRRRFLLWFDWDRFTHIRAKEVRRLFADPLVSVSFDSEYVSIRPLEAQHREQFFLICIARQVAECQPKVINLTQKLFGPHLSGGNVRLGYPGSDGRILEHLRKVVGNRVSFPFEKFMTALEAGYASTLTLEESSRFYLRYR